MQEKYTKKFFKEKPGNIVANIYYSKEKKGKKHEECRNQRNSTANPHSDERR